MGRGQSAGLKWLALLAYLTIVFAGAFLAFIVPDLELGRVVAVLAVVAFLAVPLGFGVVAENIAEKRGRELHAEKVAAVLAPIWSIAFVVVLCVWLRGPTALALADLPEPFRRLGLALGPANAKAKADLAARPKASASAQAATTPSPTAPSSVPSTGAMPARFASGDPTYSEPTDGCEPLAAIADVESAYAPGATRAAAEGIAKARYPNGLPFLQAQDDKQLKTWFTGAPDTFDGVASRFDAAVHEGAHLWGVKRFNGRTQTYPVRRDLAVEAKLQKNFFRSEILSRHIDQKTDTYAKVYLEGASGAQGFNTLLDEYNAYAHSLASRYCTRDLLSPSSRVSARDGILTMMYYLETYLAIGRTEHPKDYAAILADPGTRRVILTVWDRAEFFLRKSQDEASLGIKTETIEAWVYDEGRLAELTRVREIK